MAEEVKSILTSLRQGPSSDREAQKLRERLAELEHIAEERERERRQLEKSLQVGLVCLPISGVIVTTYHNTSSYCDSQPN